MNISLTLSVFRCLYWSRWEGERKAQSANQVIYYLAYVVCSVIALYFNVLVLIVQSFQKVPPLKALAPTQSEPPFALAQLVTLALFIAYTTLAAVRFRLEPSTKKSAPFEFAMPRAREVVNVQDRK